MAKKCGHFYQRKLSRVNVLYVINITVNNFDRVYTPVLTTRNKILLECRFCTRFDAAFTLRERSNIIWRLGRGFAQTVRVPSYWGKGFGQTVI